MIRYAVQWPEMFMEAPDNDYNGARQEFIRLFKPVIFMPRFKWRLTRARGHKKVLERSKLISPYEVDWAFSVGELNRKADVLIHFGQSPPQNLEKLAPPRGFRGLKIWHVFEYVFDTVAVNQLLEDNGVDYVLGYTDHGRHCAYFQKHHPRYVDRVLPYPFGASRRFLVDAPWEGRQNRVIALGSVNLVDEPGCDNRLQAYANFYAKIKFTHQWRRLLVENEAALAGVMDSHLPHFPQMKNHAYDSVKMLTNYRLFANDEGLMCFPPARTFEGAAAGAAMISSDHASYGDLGFRDGVNCVMHRKHDVDDFRDKAEYYQQHSADLLRIATAGQKLVRTHYTHEAVARRLAAQIEIICATGKRPETRFPEQLIPN